MVIGSDFVAQSAREAHSRKGRASRARDKAASTATKLTGATRAVFCETALVRQFSPRVFAKQGSDDGELRSALYTSKPQKSARATNQYDRAAATTTFQTKASTRDAALAARKNSTASSKILARHTHPDSKQPFQFDSEKVPELNLAGFTTSKARQMAARSLSSSREPPQGSATRLAGKMRGQKHASTFDGNS